MIIIALILIFLCFGSLFFMYADDDSMWEYLVICLILVVAFILILISTFKPKAMDVYKGKTEIVLIENSIGNLDSIVVWKGDKK